METKMKGLYALMDFMLVTIFGITILDLMVIFTGGEHNLITLDNGIKTLLALAGLVYFIFVKIPNEVKMNKLNRKIKREQLEKMEMENDDYKENHK